MSDGTDDDGLGDTALPPTRSDAPDLDDAEAVLRLSRLGGSIDQYELLSVLGHGSMGTVYRVRHAILGREYALKVLATHAAGADLRARRFLREARASAQLEHPNVVRVVYSGISAGGEAFLVMELLDGQPLSSVIAEGRVEGRRAAAIVRQLALGLEAIHARGFLHRDLKPSNVMLVATPTGEQAKILDLGLVGSAVPDRAEVRLTQQGLVMGTPMYMAPETFTAGEFGPTSDLYALGVLLYELLAGHPPFTGTMQEILWQQCFTPPPPLVAEHGLDALAVALMAKEPAARPASARAVVEEIDRRLSRGRVATLIEDGSARVGRGFSRSFAPASLAPPASLARRAGRSQRAGLLVGAASVLIVGAALGATWWTRARPPGAEAAVTRAPAPAPDPSAPLAAAPAAPLAAAPLAPAPLAAPRAEVTAPSAQAAAPAPATPAPAELPPPPPLANSPRPRSAPGTARPSRPGSAPHEVVVTSEPEGARVSMGAGTLGLTPLSVLLSSDQPTTLVLHLDGHPDRTVRVAARAPAVHVTFEDAR